MEYVIEQQPTNISIIKLNFYIIIFEKSEANQETWKTLFLDIKLRKDFLETFC